VRAKLIVGEPLHLGLERVYLMDDGPEAFEESFVGGSEDLRGYFVENYSHNIN
jgi:hypothetical protein